MPYKIYVPENIALEHGIMGRIETTLYGLIEHARILGLNNHVSTFEQMRACNKSGPNGMNPLSLDEVFIWRKALMFTYSDNTPDNTYLSRGDGYNSLVSFELVTPKEVMEVWTRLKEQWLFDRYDIWTSAGMQDCALIGKLGDDRYLLARWCKSETDTLIGFDDIVKRLWEERSEFYTHKAIRLGLVCTNALVRLIAICTIVIVALLAVKGMFGVEITGFVVALSLVGILNATLISYVLWRSKRLEQKFIELLFEQSTYDIVYDGECFDLEHLRAICRLSGQAPRGKSS